MRVLIIEDDAQISQQLSDYLKEAGFVTCIAENGEDGMFEGDEGGYDAILLDLGLPGMDGISILEHWRKNKIATPVIILTARSGKMEVIRGLEAGADDYITKPFMLEEVAARVRASIRRFRGNMASEISCGDVVFDIRSGRVLKDGKFVKLTKLEFLLLQYLFMNQGRPVSVNEIIEHTYDDFDNDSAIIAKHIANIRKKLGAKIIITEANRGYYVPKE